MKIAAAHPRIDMSLIPAKYHNALDAEQVSNIWQNQVDSQWATFGLESVTECELLRVKAGKRCLIRYRCQTTRGQFLDVLGKVRFKSLDQRAEAVAQQLRHAGFRERGTWSVARPLGVIRQWNMSLQEMLSATTLAPDHPSFIETAFRVGQSLAQLHCGPCRVARTHDFEDEIALLWRRLVKVANPVERMELERIVRSCHEYAPRVGACRSLLHRDFYFDQVLQLDDGNLAIIDWDLAAVGDSALDVGNYLAHLTEFGIRSPELASACQEASHQFLQGYQGENPAVSRIEIERWHYISLVRHLFLARELPGRRQTIPGLWERLQGWGKKN